MKLKEENTVEIMILIARIIVLILSGMSSVGAVGEVAKASGVTSAILWNKLPNRFK